MAYYNNCIWSAAVSCQWVLAVECQTHFEKISFSLALVIMKFLAWCLVLANLSTRHSLHHLVYAHAHNQKVGSYKPPLATPLGWYIVNMQFRSYHTCQFLYDVGGLCIAMAKLVLHNCMGKFYACLHTCDSSCDDCTCYIMYYL